MKGICQLSGEMSHSLPGRGRCSGLYPLDQVLKSWCVARCGLILAKAGRGWRCRKIRYSGRGSLVVWSVEPQEVSSNDDGQGEKRAGNVNVFISSFLETNLKNNNAAHSLSIL